MTLERNRRLQIDDDEPAIVSSSAENAFTPPPAEKQWHATILGSSTRMFIVSFDRMPLYSTVPPSRGQYWLTVIDGEHRGVCRLVNTTGVETRDGRMMFTIAYEHLAFDESLKVGTTVRLSSPS